MIILYLGNVGCLTGDTLINVNRCGRGNKYRLDYMYSMFHNNYKDKTKQWNLKSKTHVRSYNGERIKLHPIKDVVYSGEKEVFKLKLIDGSSIKATTTHEIMTDKGFVELQNITSEHKIMCDTLHPKSNNQKSFKTRPAVTRVLYHPYKNKKSEITAHVVTFEAKINNLHILDYLNILCNDETKSKELKFINPQEYCIHHIDGNHWNNNIDNLKLIEHDEHKKQHAINDLHYTNFNQGIPIYKEWISCEYVGLKKTYDIICEEPYRNFVANGIIVHNSGKSACAVRHMVLNKHMNYYTNILPKKQKLTPNIITIQSDMIIEKKIISYKKSGEAIEKLDLNKDYWMNDALKPLSVVLDEAHDFMDARRSMSKTNQILGKFLALARRIVGETDAEGDLIFITQLDRRIDVICREMAHQIRYHICHYYKTCKKCGCTWRETSETPEKASLCFYCGWHGLEKSGFCIEVMHFANIQAYEGWKEWGMNNFHRHYFIRDIEQYFPYYNTLQWDNLFEDLY